MSDDFTYDDLAVPDDKENAHSPTTPAAQTIVAAEWNRVCAALVSLRTAIKAGDYHGLVDNIGELSGALEARLRVSDGLAQISQNGAAYRSALHPHVNVLDFGADPTGVADSAPAINAAIQTFSAEGGTVYGYGTVIIPQGKYKLLSPILLDRGVVLEGMGPGAYYGVGLFPALGVTAILQQAVSGQVVENNTIRNIEIVGPNGIGTWTGAEAHGIDARFAIRIENVRVFNMTGHGINLVPDLIGDLCYVNCVDIYNCGGDGIHISGGDANAGLFMRCSVVACGGWGINDNSFLGNTHIGHHTNGNFGPFKAEQAANYSLWLGCYSEGGQADSIIGGNGSIVIGGDHGCPVGGGAFSILEGHSATRLLFQTNAAGFSGTRGECVQIGGSDPLTLKNKFSIDFSGGTYMALALRGPSVGQTDYPSTGDAAQPFGNSSWITWFPGGSEIIRSAVGHYRASFPSNVTGAALTNRAVEPGASWFDFMYLGGSSLYGGNARRVASVHSNLTNLDQIAPTWQLGDLIFNANPVNNGDPMGWICAAPGTFGTYAEGLTADYVETTGYGYVYQLSAPSTVLKIGDRLTINGVAGTVSNLTYSDIDSPEDWDKVVFSANAGSGSGYTIAYAGAPTFKAIALLEHASTGVTQRSQAADGASAVASIEDTTNALSTSGAKLKVWKNNGVEKASIDKDGNGTFANMSGTNTGDVTLGTFGSSPDAKGATISGQVVTLQPADATHPGLVTDGTQTIAGAKTLSNDLTITTGKLLSPTADSGSAVGVILDTTNAFTTADAKFLSVRTGNTERFMIRQTAGGNTEIGSIVTGQLTGRGFAEFKDSLEQRRLRMAATERTIFQGDATDGAGVIACTSGNVASLSNATAKIHTFTNDAGTTEKAAIMASGKLSWPAVDISGTPGDGTANAVVGKAAIASTASAVDISNSVVKAGDYVMITPLDNDTTLLTYKVAVSDGHIVVTGGAAAAANWKFQFVVMRGS